MRQLTLLEMSGYNYCVTRCQMPESVNHNRSAAKTCKLAVFIHPSVSENFRLSSLLNYKTSINFAISNHLRLSSFLRFLAILTSVLNV
jgi:hypothetical protein